MGYIEVRYKKARNYCRCCGEDYKEHEYMGSHRHVFTLGELREVYDRGLGEEPYERLRAYLYEGIEGVIDTKEESVLLYEMEVDKIIKRLMDEEKAV